ncbi:MAG: hypothetical protein RRX92_04545 [Lachnospiraceae bacterium]
MDAENIQIKELSIEDMANLYEPYLKEHFPANELKKLEHMQKMYTDGIYKGLGLYHEEELLAYAFYITIPCSSYALLDYYAVLKPYRSLGVGGIFLERLTDTWLADLASSGSPALDGVFLEVEDPAGTEDISKKQIRQKRIDFYFAHHVVDTALYGKQFGVEYKILFLSNQAPPQDEVMVAKLWDLYHTVFSAETIEKDISLWI